MKPRISVHKFASCDGCQLALLNAGEDLLRLAAHVEIVHFAEAGPINPEAEVDVALVEGSITTAHDIERINSIRALSRFVMTIGACATSGGLQALRNYADIAQWTSSIYAHPEYIATLATSTPIRNHIHVDFELWGCPVNSHQVFSAVRDLLSGIVPISEDDKVCLECKRKNHTCVMVTQGLPCLGPVTRTGCGALCPGVGRACYGCYGPAENLNSESLAAQYHAYGLSTLEIVNRFRYFHSTDEQLDATAENWTGK